MGHRKGVGPAHLRIGEDFVGSSVLEISLQPVQSLFDQRLLLAEAEAHDMCRACPP